HRGPSTPSRTWGSTCRATYAERACLHHPAPALGVDEFVDFAARVEDEDCLAIYVVEVVGRRSHRCELHRRLADHLDATEALVLLSFSALPEYVVDHVTPSSAMSGR